MALYDTNGRMVGTPTNGAGNSATMTAVPPPETTARTNGHSPEPAPHAAAAPVPVAEPPPVAAGIGDVRSPVFSVPRLPIDELLRTMLAQGEGVSDLFFIVGRAPQVENFGKLMPVEGTQFSPAFTAQQTEGLAHWIVGAQQRLLDDLRNTGSCDCSYALGDTARFRVNVFKQKGSFAMVLRKLNTRIPTMEDLNLPPVFKRIILEKTGLIFVTGATGSGKTTTLAAMLNGLNESHPMHIVTLEDPVEFMHPHKAATFCQREMGKDFSSFAMGLRPSARFPSSRGRGFRRRGSPSAPAAAPRAGRSRSLKNPCPSRAGRRSPPCAGA